MSSEAKKKGGKEKKTQERKEEAVERGVMGVASPSLEEVGEYVKSVRVLTPSAVAERFRVRLSVAKAILRELVSKGWVKEVVGSNRVRVYAPLVQTSASEAKTVETVEKPAKAKKSSKKSAS
ncbi:MAG: eS25 family ribosomal protein [Candidatus Caldarchaeum sp.]